MNSNDIETKNELDNNNNNKENIENKNLRQNFNSNLFKNLSKKTEVDEQMEINHWNVDNLKKFINRQGRIVSRKHTKLSAKNQRKLSRSVKRARQLLLVPYSSTGEGI